MTTIKKKLIKKYNRGEFLCQNIIYIILRIFVMNIHVRDIGRFTIIQYAIEIIWIHQRNAFALAYILYARGGGVAGTISL